MNRFNRFRAVLRARNLEFVRDRAALGWNLALPFALVLGLAVVFAGDEKPLYKVGVLHAVGQGHPLQDIRYLELVGMKDKTNAIDALVHHRLDLLVDLQNNRYWLNEESAKGYIVERLLLGLDVDFSRQSVSGALIRYIDWLLPGILGMNMMFSCLWGVGYVVVRYRKSGFLKRLNATPLQAMEFILAQIASRLILINAVTLFVFFGIQLFIDLRMEGSYLLLLLLMEMGAVSLIALGFLFAARVSSEELAGGLLNLITWPMMMLSGVWFSLEGSFAWIQFLAKLMPLTQLLESVRAVMLDGAGFVDVLPNILAMLLMTIVFMTAGIFLFKWRMD